MRVFMCFSREDKGLLVVLRYWQVALQSVYLTIGLVCSL